MCGLFAFADCSNNDECCSDCSIKGSGEVCRDLDIDNPCDIIGETCDGASAQCPPDTFSIEGTECTQDDTLGYCYNGKCKTIDEQCDTQSNKCSTG